MARTNMQLNDVAAELEQRKISYTSSGAIKDIYEHFIFADTSYLRLINGGWRSNDLLQVLNKPVRYLREIDFRVTKALDLDILLENVQKNENSRNTNIGAVTKLYYDIQDLQNVTLAEQVKGIAEQIGYRSYLFDYAEVTNQNDDFLMVKLDFFIADAEQYTSTDAWLGISSYHVQCHKKQMRDKSGKAITLSTMHRAEGLEWDTVFIIDCCHASIPISKAKLTPAIEKERRLFYVAITRAREALYQNFVLCERAFSKR